MAAGRTRINVAARGGFERRAGVALRGSQHQRDAPKSRAVVRVDDMRDFVPERVQGFRKAVFAVRLPA